MTQAAATPYLESVRDQYEDLPYPLRNPQEEKSRLRDPFYDALELINYYCFEGRQNFQNGFRALVAGAGTGDTVIYLAEQLRHANAEIVYLDISRASMNIAKERAAIRKLTNITWASHSLLEIPSLDLGKFDYINCSGVLHHLADPDEGLKALAGALKENGALGIMVYGQYGRTGVYHVQEMMRLLMGDEPNKQLKVDVCRKLLDNLPASNWFNMGRKMFSVGLSNEGDVEHYDLFLHSQDRAYTVPQLYEWLERCGLKLVDFMFGGGIAKSFYNPANYLPPQALPHVQQLSVPEKQALAELMTGDIIMHCLYAAKRQTPKPSCRDEAMMPFMAYALGAYMSYAELFQLVRDSQSEAVKVRHPRINNMVTVKKRRFTADLLEAMDGNKTVGSMLHEVLQRHGLSADPEARRQMLDDWELLFTQLNMHDWLLLRHESVPAFKSSLELQQDFVLNYS